MISLGWICFLGCLISVYATHFRGGTISWTRVNGTSKTVNFNVVMHFYTGGVMPTTSDITLNFGDGAKFAPSLNGTSNKIDGSGLIRTIIYNITKTYGTLRTYVAYVRSCCRQSAVINGGNKDFQLEAGVNLALATCVGNPRATIPGQQVMQISPTAKFSISPTTPGSAALAYSFFNSSFLTINPPRSPANQAASLVSFVPSSLGVYVKWNSSACALNSIYAVSTRADIVNQPNCHATWDVALLLIASVPPQCTAGNGVITAYTTNNVSLTYAAVDSGGMILTPTLIGDLPVGGQLLLGSNPVTFSWTAPLVAGSYAWTVQYCNTFNLCGACSTSLNVNDALPQVQVAVEETPTTPGVTGLGANYTYSINATNVSNGNQTVTVTSVTSSLHGSVGECSVGLALTPSETYSCSYSRPAESSAPNVISVQVENSLTGAVVVGADAVTVIPNATAVISDALCFGQASGSIEIQVTGGYAPYNFVWSTGDTATGTGGAILRTLIAGSYAVTVTDLVGAQTTLSQLMVRQPAVFTVVGTITAAGCDAVSGAISLSLQGGTWPYAFFWTPSGAQTQSISDLVPGSYSVEVTDGNLCRFSQSFSVPSGCTTNAPTMAPTMAPMTMAPTDSPTATTTTTTATTTTTMTTTTITVEPTFQPSVVLTEAIGTNSSLASFSMPWNSGGPLTFTLVVQGALCSTPASFCGLIFTTVAESCKQNRALCVVDEDCGDLSAGLVGACVNGACQCGFGFANHNGLIVDPPSCAARTCVPPAMNSVDFLTDPIVSINVENGVMFHNVSVKPSLYMKPVRWALINPATLQYCGILPELLGACTVAQMQNPSTCGTDYIFSSRFSEMLLRSGCFSELPLVTSSGAGFSVLSRSFETIVEVVLNASAPISQEATRQQASLTPVSRALQQRFVYTVVAALEVESGSFTVVANGQIAYRLKSINISATGGSAMLLVETRVPDRGMLVNAQLKPTPGIPPLARNDLISSLCDTQSVLNRCVQFHTLLIPISPCLVSGSLTVEMQLVCAAQDADPDPNTCDFINVPVGGIFELGNMAVDYDACAQVTKYGVDSPQSFLRIYEDAARTQLLSAQPLNTVAYVRAQLAPGSGASFRNVSMVSLVAWQKAGIDVNLGDIRARNFVSGLGRNVTSPSLSQWDFDLLLDDSFFVGGKAYYLQATFDLVFLETGLLQRRHRSVLALPVQRRVSLAGAVSNDVTLLPAAVRPSPSGEDTVVADPALGGGGGSGSGGAAGATAASGSSNVAWAAGAVAAVLVALVVGLLILRRSRNREAQGQSVDTTPEMGGESNDVL